MLYQSILINEYRLTARLLKKMFYIKIEKDVQMMKDEDDLIDIRNANEMRVSKYHIIVEFAKNMEVCIIATSSCVKLKFIHGNRHEKIDFFLTFILSAFYLVTQVNTNIVLSFLPFNK